MKIRSKLAWTFIILLIAGITTVSSYSILFIRNYLLQEGLVELRKDSQRLAVTIAHLRLDGDFRENLQAVTETVGYQIALYDSGGSLISSYPNNFSADIYLSNSFQTLLKTRKGLAQINDSEDGEKLISSIYLPSSGNPVTFIKLSQYKDNIYHPIQTIRWIIYYGMFISIGLVIIVSLWISRYLTKPITQIKDAAQAIATGDVERKINLTRKDEFGELADSLNQMADKLRWDTEQMKAYADKQRQFFADITHEIRNPLHTISGSLEMMRMDNLPDDKRQKYHKNAQSQIKRMTRLFTDLKTLQRYDSDRHFVELHPFNMAQIAKHMLEWYEEKAAGKGLKLNIETHECRVIGDVGKIEQVLDNLISNAIKFTNEGSVSLNYHSKNDRVKVAVKDTGPGLSQEHMEHLFDRFYRTDKARSRDKGGTGLGLAVVKSILEAHDTEIHAESRPGEGSEFWFELKSAIKTLRI